MGLYRGALIYMPRMTRWVCGLVQRGANVHAKDDQVGGWVVVRAYLLQTFFKMKKSCSALHVDVFIEVLIMLSSGQDRSTKSGGVSDPGHGPAETPGGG